MPPFDLCVLFPITRNWLFRLRVDLTSLRPDKAIVHLNKVMDGRPVFCLPSIEGVGAPLATLAAKIPFPVYSVQAVTAAPQDNIEQLALFYAQVLSRLKLEIYLSKGSTSPLLFRKSDAFNPKARIAYSDTRTALASAWNWRLACKSRTRPNRISWNR